MIQAGSPLLLKKNPGLSTVKFPGTPNYFFQAICCNPAIFKYKDKQHFLIIKKFNNIIEVHNFVTQAAQCVHECCLSVEINVWQARILCKVENDRCVHRTSEYRHPLTTMNRCLRSANTDSKKTLRTALCCMEPSLRAIAKILLLTADGWQVSLLVLINVPFPSPNRVNT